MGGMIDNWLEVLSREIIDNFWLAPFLALFAGILTSFTPCSLSTVPLVIGYVGSSGEKSTKKAFLLSAVFSAGMAVTFTTLGTAASLVGKLMQGTGSWWYILLGILMLLMALQTWELFNFLPATHAISKSKSKGFLGAFLAGILGGLFSSPCSTPVLIALLAIVAREGDILRGIFLLLLYSIGHSVLVMIAGTSIGFVKKLSSIGNYGKASTVLRIIMGALILLVAFYMFYLGF